MDNVGTAVIFSCMGQLMAFDMLSVTDIINTGEFTPIPKLPDFISGVINHMGDVIPVVDLAKKLGLGDESYTKRSCLIGISLDEGTVAVRVKEILTSADYGEDNFIEIAGENSIAKGYITLPEGRVTLLDAKKAL